MKEQTVEPWRCEVPRPRKWIPGDDEFKLDPQYPVDWPEHYPPLDNRRKNLKWRAREVKLSLKSARRRSIHKTLCKRDMFYWWAGWSWVYETRSTGEMGSVLPFIPYDYQIETGLDLKQSIHEQHDLAMPKSRDMGLTWIALLTLQHEWLFTDGFTALLASIKQDLVDKLGDPTALFEKLRFNLKRQPRWMLPGKFDWNQHDKFLLLTNPSNGSSIAGSTTTTETGRSGRYNVVMIDEHAALKRGDANNIEASTADAAAARWYISTPRGDLNLFFQKCTNNQTKRVDVHWHRHPYKGYQAWTEVEYKNGKVFEGKTRSPWYDFIVAERDQPEWMIAQEQDISFSGSLDTFLDAGVLKKWRADLPEPIETRFVNHRRDGEPAMLIFEKPIPGSLYLLCADPSGGTATGSFTALHLLRIPGLVQAVEYQGRIGIDILSTLIYVLAVEYNWAYIAVESNIGVECLNNLANGHIDREGINGEPNSIVDPYDYERIIRHTKTDGTETDKLGIWTSEPTKNFMARSLLEPVIRNQDTVIKGRRTLSEMSGFREDGSRIHNPDGDDLVMAYNIGLYGYRFMPLDELDGPAPFRSL